MGRTGQSVMSGVLFPGSYWVEVSPDSTHRVHRSGQRFLVVEERPGGFLLCWRDGIEPPPRILGTYIHERYTQPC